MQANARSRNPRTNAYRKVLDSRKRLVCGLWQRNGKFYANITISGALGRKSSRWVALLGASLEDAKSDFARLLTERDDERLQPMGQTRKLSASIGERIKR